MAWKRVIGPAVAAALAAALLVWWLLPSEEDRIVRRLEEAARALEAEDAVGVVSIVDPALFEDPYGHTAEEVEEALDQVFLDFDGIEVTMEHPRVVLEDSKRQARVIVRFYITGTYEGQFGFIVGNMKELAMVRLIMEKSDEFGWRVAEVTAAVLPGAS